MVTESSAILRPAEHASDWRCARWTRGIFRLETDSAAAVQRLFNMCEALSVATIKTQRGADRRHDVRIEQRGMFRRRKRRLEEEEGEKKRDVAASSVCELLMHSRLYSGRLQTERGQVWARRCFH